MVEMAAGFQPEEAIEHNARAEKRSLPEAISRLAKDMMEALRKRTATRPIESQPAQKYVELNPKIDDTPTLYIDPSWTSSDRELTTSSPTSKERSRLSELPMESTVTKHYFETWDDDVQVIGNLGMKERIRHNILQSEHLYTSKYLRAARYSFFVNSEEELKAKLQEMVEEAIAKSDFFTAVNAHTLDQMLNVDGRLKSQFETAKSSGLLTPTYRAATEARLFAFNDSGDVDLSYSKRELPEKMLESEKAMRPIYGYLSDHGNGVVNYEGTIPPQSNLTRYGRINIKLNRAKVAKRTTVLFDDSLHANQYDELIPPTPAEHPHFTSFPAEYLAKLKENDVQSLQTSKVRWGQSGYAEAQFHGQIKLEDIESIHISPNNGMTQEEIQGVRDIFQNYKIKNPDSAIQLIEY